MTIGRSVFKKQDLLILVQVLKHLSIYQMIFYNPKDKSDLGKSRPNLSNNFVILGRGY